MATARTQSAWAGRLETLNPGWFALVMATGIVAIAASLTEIPVVPSILLWANIGFYGVLWVLFIGRLALYSDAFITDFGHHLRGMGYFTIVAGTTVLGAATLIVGEWPAVAKWLWVWGFALFMVLMYAVPIAQMLLDPKPDIKNGIIGNWLVWIVACQGVALLGARVAPQWGSQAQNIVLLMLMIHLGGFVIYIWVIALILQRLFFGKLEPAELSPTYWITMGAAAISTLAGSILIQEVVKYSLLDDLAPFLKGFTLLIWGTASWWIPWLIVMGIWRHIVRRHTLAFEPGWWSMVFPIGMYTAATFTFSQAIGYPEIRNIAEVAVWFALFAWAFTIVNMIVTLSRRPLPANAT